MVPPGIFEIDLGYESQKLARLVTFCDSEVKKNRFALLEALSFTLRLLYRIFLQFLSLFVVIKLLELCKYANSPFHFLLLLPRPFIAGFLMARLLFA